MVTRGLPDCIRIIAVGTPLIGAMPKTIWGFPDRIRIIVVNPYGPASCSYSKHSLAFDIWFDFLKFFLVLLDTIFPFGLK